MIKRALLLLLTIVCITACRENVPTFTLSGTYGNGKDTLFVFGLDNRHDIVDTIVTGKKGDFTYETETDTVLPLTIVLPDGTMLPLYAEPDVEGRLVADNRRKEAWRIEAGASQALYDSIAVILDSIEERSQRYSIIDNFIAKHPLSEVNIHLLQEHLIEIPDAKNALIRQRIDKLGGTLQDHEYLSDIKAKTKSQKSNIQHSAFPFFSCITADNDTVTRTDYLDKYLIVTFWASWDSASIKRMHELHHLGEKLDTTYFAMLNIAMDHDTAAWRRTIERDTIAGDNVCDAKMWENEIAKEFTIEKLPFSILVNPYQRVSRFDVSPNSIEEELIEQIEKFDRSMQKKKKEKEKSLSARKKVTMKPKSREEEYGKRTDPAKAKTNTAKESKVGKIRKAND